MKMNKTNLVGRCNIALILFLKCDVPKFRIPSPFSHNVILRQPPPSPLTCDLIYGCPLTPRPPRPTDLTHRRLSDTVVVPIKFRFRSQYHRVKHQSNTTFRSCHKTISFNLRVSGSDVEPLVLRSVPTRVKLVLNSLLKTMAHRHPLIRIVIENIKAYLLDIIVLHSQAFYYPCN